MGYKKKITGGFYKVGYGKLYRKFYNLRRQMRQSGLLTAKLPTASTTVEDGNPDNSTLDIDDDVEWLKNSIEPWTEVIEKWDITFEKRILWRNRSINDYMDRFPALKLKLGHVLVSFIIVKN